MLPDRSSVSTACAASRVPVMLPCPATEVVTLMIPPGSIGSGSIVVITEIKGPLRMRITILPSISYPESLSTFATTVASPAVSDCSMIITCPRESVVPVAEERVPGPMRLKLTVLPESVCPHLSITVAVIVDMLTPGMFDVDIFVASAVTTTLAGSSA